MGGKRNERETREKGERGLRAHSTAHTARNTAREREREMGYGGSHPVKCVLCGVVCSNVATTTRLANTDSRYSISLISRQIKYSGPGGGHRRKMVDDHEENLTISGAKLERARLKYVEKDEDAKAEKERVCETELGVKGAGGAIPMRTKERIWVCSWKSKERTNAPRRAREQAKQTKPAGVWVGGGGRCGGRGAVAISIRSRSPNSLLLCVHVCV